VNQIFLQNTWFECSFSKSIWWNSSILIEITYFFLNFKKKNTIENTRIESFELFSNGQKFKF